MFIMWQGKKKKVNSIFYLNFKGGNANSDGSNSDNSNNDNSNKVHSFPEKTTSRIVTSSSTDLKSGLIDSQSKSTNIQRFQK